MGACPLTAAQCRGVQSRWGEPKGCAKRGCAQRGNAGPGMLLLLSSVPLCARSPEPTPHTPMKHAGTLTLSLMTGSTEG